MDLATHYLQDSIRLFAYQKGQVERALEQLEDKDLNHAIDGESNSIATIIQHLYGNMRSRWSNFLGSDGEKANRKRDDEFLARDWAKGDLLELWQQGWEYLFTALERLNGDDLLKEIVIRQEPHTVLQAIERQKEHYAMHCGQIIFLAKHLKGQDWQSITVPKGKSVGFKGNYLTTHVRT